MYDNEFHYDIFIRTPVYRSYSLPCIACFVTLPVLWIHFLFTAHSFPLPCPFIPLGDPGNFLGLFTGAQMRVYLHSQEPLSSSYTTEKNESLPHQS